MSEPLLVVPTSAFRSDRRRLVRRGADLGKLKAVLQRLANGEALPAAMRDHPLTGDYAPCRECFITPTWSLIYRIADTEMVLVATRTGSHPQVS